MSMAMIGRDSAANYVDTFKRRQAIYWQETLVPIVRALEDAFDTYFTDGPMRTGLFVRFDLTHVEALQQEMGATLDNAAKLRALGVPLSVVDSVLSLNLPLADIPGADEAWVPSGQSPVQALLNDWNTPAEPVPAALAKPEDDPESDTGKAAAAPGQVKAGQPNPPRSGRPSVTRAEIMKRASDARAQIQRSRRQLALERGCAKTWRLAAGDVKKDAVAIVRRLAAVPGATVATVQRDLPPAMRDVRAKARKDLPAAVAPYHVKAAALGVFSLQYLLGKVEIDDCDLYLKAPVLSEAARKVVRDRENLVAQMSDDLFDRMMLRVAVAVVEGAEASEVSAFVADEFNASVNRSVTIARTEVGSAYNASRFTEMGEQGFAKHEWLSSVDELTRESHAESNGEVRAIGEVFPCGLSYPMEPGGDPGNVINCRCETIPAVEV
jgi:SPP1 gp7 family putative phage head morphogenesis protein